MSIQARAGRVRSYIIRRLLILIPTLLFLTLLVFVLTSLIPGDIVTSIKARIPEELIDRAALEKQLGLDKPLLVQYGRWLGAGSFSATRRYVLSETQYPVV